MTFFVLTGQTVATILGRFYYDQGGDSKWMATLVQSAGSLLFLLPLLLLSSSNSPNTSIPYSLTSKAAIYILFGIVIASDNLMYSYGLLFLPVSTYSLICATQLAFNAVFSYYINSEKLTAPILNSVVLLTFSAALLGLHAGSETSVHVSGEKYTLGFILTLAAAALFSLLLSLMQLTFEKFYKRVTFRVVLELQTYTNFIATCTSVVGLFARGEWRSLRGEMEEFKKGTEAYVMTLVWTAISWQVASVGLVGLVFVASSLLANMIGTLALPLVPIFAVIFFHDRLDGVKVMAMMVALWGFLSYIYQQYLDDSKAKKFARAHTMEISVVSSPSV
ncbi:hypothetical protein J5N97_029588 [Dioscorea zingiberensis]|uniref:Probable purine permease n=1 Tax=Dioscorea zingiberensis TaxID=325984 RepID=A0A9D5BW87_9LILI|nr:hypothetical protein J5N97_029588 [Dioscorea zingiberensis]